MLNDFSTVFEILALANAGYTGSKNFRGAINNPLHRHLVDPISNRLEKLKAEVKMIQNQRLLGGDQLSDEHIDYRNTNNAKIVACIKSQKNHSRRFVSDFRVIFFLAFSYCVEIILIGGYEQFYSEKDVADLLFFLNIQGFFILVYFVRNLFASRLPSKIPTIFILIYITLPIGLYIIFQIFESPLLITLIEQLENEKINISLSIAIALSSYFLFLLRAFIHVIVYASKLRKLIRSVEIDKVSFMERTETELDVILKDN